MESGDRRLTTVRPAFLAVGRIGRAHGVRGEVRVEVMTDFPERRFAKGSRLLMGPEGSEAPEPVAVASVRRHKGWLLVRFEGADDRTTVERLSGRYLFVPAADAASLEPDTYYHHDLVGCAVLTDAGIDLGLVVEVMETGTADVLVVRSPDGQREVLLPMIADVVREIDADARRITITPIAGLL